MDDWLIDDDRLSLSRKSRLPGEGFFHPDSVEEVEREREAEATLTDAPAVVVADPDADGLACTALVREAVADAALLPAGPRDIKQALTFVTEYADAGVPVFVCDLCPDSPEDVDPLGAVAELASEVHWFDHHQWDEALGELVDDHVTRRVVGESEEECTADVAVRSLDYDFPDHLEALAVVTRDHDLWLREDPRSDDLADYAYWADPEEYVDVVREHGPDLPAAVEEFLAEQRVEKEALIEFAVDRAEIRDIGPWTVGITYGRCSQNEVAEALREQGTDAAVIVKPAGSASIRGTDSFEHAHEVAGKVNGGGHPKAAGCKPDIYDDMLDYAHHWTTEGAVAKQVIIEAFHDVKREVEAADEE
ncbi:DHH family phosphoesterase [Halorientalis litorea]|jgi:oligoribonuclease NrnB/cAMP/cGMP phosphodiesterase (DHH superfamily)|uniref:DHH family phosphoesterase n=1 Tax=Halorientalis litorea TaxID=2931977 RepID=UPI001FF6D71E|nr:recombinase RecJ [Halorientalis litorea]